MFRHSWVHSSLDLLPALLAHAASTGGVALLHAAFPVQKKGKTTEEDVSAAYFNKKRPEKVSKITNK